MKIQKCKKCGKKFEYIDVIESIGWGYKPLTCRCCGAKYNLKMWYIFTIAVLLSLPMFFTKQILIFISILSLKTAFSVLFYIIYILLIVGVYPFIIRYTLADEKSLNCWFENNFSSFSKTWRGNTNTKVILMTWIKFGTR